MGTLATYDDIRDRWRYLADSYWGGERYACPSSTVIGTARIHQWVQSVDDAGRYTGQLNARTVASRSSYLLPHEGETVEAFDVRRSAAAYINLIAPIADAYVDAVTGPVTRDLAALGTALVSMDGQGSGWAEIVEDVARWATVYGWCALLLDLPETNPARTLAEERALGVSVRATVIHPPAIAWVEVDRDGKVNEIAFTDQPYAIRDSGVQQVDLYVYTPDRWARHTVTVPSGTSGWQDTRRTLLNAVPTAQGEVRGGEVPVAFAYFRRDTSSPAPQGISLVSDAADLARAIYNGLSQINEIHSAAAPFMAVPTPESSAGALDPQTRMQIGPRYAMGYPSSAGAPQWVQMGGETTREIREHCVFLGAMALRTTGLEVSAGDSPADASGTALRIRSRDFDARCVRFAKGMHAFELRALRIVAGLLGRSDDGVAVTYPKRFSLPDSAADLSRALLAIQGVGEMLGPQARAALVRQVLDSAVSVDDEALAAMVAEMASPVAIADDAVRRAEAGELGTLPSPEEVMGG